MTSGARWVAILFAFFLAVALPAEAVYAHGCQPNEPDRDEDGVADRDDAYPDDPTRWQESDVLVKIFHIPFGANLREPIGCDTIKQKRRTEIWVVANHDIVRKIKAVFKQPNRPVTLDQKKIRMKIEFPKENAAYCIDAEGHAFRDEETKFMLTKGNLKVLEQVVRDLNGVMDITQTQQIFGELPAQNEAAT